MAEFDDNDKGSSSARKPYSFIRDPDADAHDGFDESGEADYTPYSNRPEWSDVVPVKQTAVPSRVIQIDYTPRFLDCFDYFRAVMASGEKSQRALDLTTDAIGLNAANYTVWQYRRDVLQALGIPNLITKDGLSPELQKEFNFSLESIEQNEKNYQVWHHRKILAQWAAGYNEETESIQLTCPEALRLLTKQELDLTFRLLEKDAKNYHTWQYRQWLLDSLKCFEGELAFVDDLLAEDVRNNSAWNQRYFVITNNGYLSPEVLQNEVRYTWSKILQAPSNESPWSYMAGLFRLTPEVTLTNTPNIVTLCENLLTEQIKTPSPALLSFLLSVYDKMLEAGSDANLDQVHQRGIEICDMLVSTDKIRSAYWSYTKDKFNTKFATSAKSPA